MLFEKQAYQEKCVNNIVNIVEQGIDLHNNDYSNFSSVISEHYNDNGYNHFKVSETKRLDIVMETGTGKTFAYIKTIFELNKRFNLNKFIIIVPRSAIRLGVLQNIRLTDEYFYNEYKKHLNVIEYPKDGLSRIYFDFLSGSNLTVLILTNSSFNSKVNNINIMTDDSAIVKSGSTWNAIAEMRPVVIIDEPHLLKGDKTTEYLRDLKDSLFLRFGATFPNDSDPWHHLSNVAYSLDSISSFNQYLVKKIRVNTLLLSGEEENFSVSITNGKKNTFNLTYGVNQQIHKKQITKGEDIGALTGIKSFKGIHPTKITAKKIFLSDGNTFDVTGGYFLSDDEIREMVRQTIKIHFEKEERLFNKNIKTLALFFIPGVSDFRGDNPRIKTIFEEEYKKIRSKYYKATENKAYKAFLDRDSNDGNLIVHEGYFSGDKGTKDDKERMGVDLILNQKEKLLSLDTNLRFIFSVWALQEGWDNPNVSTICKIASTKSDTSRRQQVGRGLRIVVNQEGRRLTCKYLEDKESDFYDINTLDIIVSGKEANFIDEIQKEINEASFSFAGDTISIDILIEKGLNQREATHVMTVLEDKEKIEYDIDTDSYSIKTPIAEYITTHRKSFPKIDDDRFDNLKKIFTRNKISVEDGNIKKHKVKIRKNKLNDFKEVWEAINRKSKIVYKKIKDDSLISEIVKRFNGEEISPVKITLEKKEYNSQKDVIEFSSVETIGDVHFFKEHGLDSFIQRFMNNGSTSSNDGFSLPLNFIMKLINDPEFKKEKISHNPKKAEMLLKQIIKEEIHKSIVQSINYEFESEIQITPLHNEKDMTYLSEIEYSKLGRMYTQDNVPKNLLYDTIVYDSNIEKEIQQHDPESIDKNEVVVFAKLPKISIPTPYKSYNPDFAYLIKRPGTKLLFLVVESKGYNNKFEIPEDEKNKITYGERFFKQLQKELPNVQIEFRTRINRKELTELLQSIKRGA